MATFHYKLKSLNGERSKGVIAAASLNEARDLLSHSDFALLSLKPLYQWEYIFQKPELKPVDLTSLFKALAQLCRAGLSLLEALKSLESNKQSYQSIIRLIEQGLPLSKSLEQSALMTNSLLLSFLKQAEIKGDYPQAFDQIIEHIKWLEDLKQRLKKTLSYPALVLLLSLGLMFFLLSFVVPQLLDLYKMSSLEVPPMTQALMTFSEAMPPVFIGATATLGTLILLTSLTLLYGRHTAFFLRRLLTSSLKTPLLGPTLRDILLLQYTKNMQALLSCQQGSILEAMTSAETSLQPSLYRTLFLQPRLMVEQGESFSGALQQHFPLPPSILKMIQVGEKSGTLPQALLHTTAYIDTHLQGRLNKLIQRLGPVMLLSVGSLLVFIIAAVFLPLYSGLGGIDT